MFDWFYEIRILLGPMSRDSLTVSWWKTRLTVQYIYRSLSGPYQSEYLLFKPLEFKIESIQNVISGAPLRCCQHRYSDPLPVCV